MRFLLLMPLAALLRKNSSREEIKKARPRIFIPASYSTKEKELALATRLNLYRAIELAKAVRPEDGVIVICSCSHPFPGAEKLEDERKAEILRENGVRFIVGKPIINSIREMEAVKEALEGAKIDYAKEGVCLVTCDFHSRAMWLLAFMILGVKALVSCNSYVFEVEPDHPTPDQRTWTRWLPLSLARLGAYLSVLFGITSLERWRDKKHKGKHE